MLSTNGTVNEASGCCPSLGVKRVILLEVDLKSIGLDTIWEISAKRKYPRTECSLFLYILECRESIPWVVVGNPKSFPLLMKSSSNIKLYIIYVIYITIYIIFECAQIQ